MYFFIQNIDHLVLLSGFPLFAVDEEKLTWNSSKNFIRLPVDTTEKIIKKWQPKKRHKNNIKTSH